MPLVIIAFAILFTIYSCSKSGGSGYNTTTPPPVTTAPGKVSISGMTFIPSTITVKAGTKITWTNNDGYNHTVTENIEAVNNEGASFLNTEKGEFAFIVLIKSFKFKKALIEEHFNEKYLESNKSPKANFKGTITDLSKVDFSTDGKYPVVVKGDLTLHGNLYVSIQP